MKEKNTHSSQEPERDFVDPENVQDAEIVEDPVEILDNTDHLDGEPDAADAAAEPSLEQQLDSTKEELEKQKKEYLFLMAEFDNFRKRTLREKAEIIRNAGEQVLKGLLPIVDDFERGLKAAATAENAADVAEGMQLIYNKLKKYLEQNGVKEFDPDDREFDADRHEAIATVPAPDESQKGKILDTVEKGYMINDKVLRHAKVVVAK